MTNLDWDYRNIDTLVENLADNVEELHSEAKELFEASKKANFEIKEDLKKAVLKWNERNPTVTIKIPIWDFGLNMLGVGNDYSLTYFIMISKNELTDDHLKKIVKLSSNFRRSDESWMHTPTKQRCVFSVVKEHPLNWQRMLKIQHYLTVIDKTAAKLVLFFLEVLPLNSMLVLNLTLEFLIIQRCFPTFSIIDNNFQPLRDLKTAIIDWAILYRDFNWQNDIVCPYFGLEDKASVLEFVRKAEVDMNKPMKVMDFRLCQTNLAESLSMEDCLQFKLFCEHILSRLQD